MFTRKRSATARRMQAAAFFWKEKMGATRLELDRWMRTLPGPWTAAMEATIFTGWIYDRLLPRAAAVKVAHHALVSSLQRDPLLAERIKRLRTIPGVGPIAALTWALEIGDVLRFRSIKQAITYCGLYGDEKSSANKVLRALLSKKRN